MLWGLRPGPKLPRPWAGIAVWFKASIFDECDKWVWLRFWIWLDHLWWVWFGFPFNGLSLSKTMIPTSIHIRSQNIGEPLDQLGKALFLEIFCIFEWHSMSPILVGLFDFHLGYLCHFSLSWVFLNKYVTMLIPSEKFYAWVLLKKKKKILCMGQFFH